VPVTHSTRVVRYHPDIRAGTIHERETHRAGPDRASWPSILNDNPYSMRPDAGPNLGQPCECYVMGGTFLRLGALAGGLRVRAEAKLEAA
jgi:hypothetical protein